MQTMSPRSLTESSADLQLDQRAMKAMNDAINKDIDSRIGKVSGSLMLH